MEKVDRKITINNVAFSASGWPKLKIEECAAKRQAMIDSGLGIYFIL